MKTQRTIRRPRQSSGQVLVITVLAIMLLVGMVFYVMNVGDQINRRVATQNAADSAAMSAGIHMARSMNTVAMNNIAISRMLSLVPVMDALPLALEMSSGEVEAWNDGLEDQLARPLSGINPQRARDAITLDLQNLQQRYATQKAAMATLNWLFNGRDGYDLSLKTVYRRAGVGSPPPHGSYWLAADHLLKFNQATASSAGVAAQINAASYGQASQADSAFVVPVVPRLPVVEGRWGDWYRNPSAEARDTVLVHGHPPDYRAPYRLGAYDKLYRWRDELRYTPHERVWVPGPGGNPGAPLNIPIPDQSSGDSGRPRAGRGGYRSFPTGPSVVTGYSTYGPYDWMRRRVFWYWCNHLLDTNLDPYHGEIAKLKLDYMFSPPPPSMQKIHYPLWITDYPTARQAVEAGARVSKTLYYTIVIRSKYPKDDPHFMDANTFYKGIPGTPRHEETADGIWANDPKTILEQQRSAVMVCDYVWEQSQVNQVDRDPEIGIDPPGPPQTAPSDGQPSGPRYPVYYYIWYVFGGIDVGGEWPVTNPANFDSTEGLPVPLMLDTSVGDYKEEDLEPRHDKGVRRDFFTYLGAARRSAIPGAWPQRFGTANPLGSMVAVAQVEIYNPKSWDLWTQDWRAQLVPVSGLANWTSRLEAGMDEAGRVNMAVQEQNLREVLEYFERFDGVLANQTIHH